MKYFFKSKLILLLIGSFLFAIYNSANFLSVMCAFHHQMNLILFISVLIIVIVTVLSLIIMIKIQNNLHVVRFSLLHRISLGALGLFIDVILDHITYLLGIPESTNQYKVIMLAKDNILGIIVLSILVIFGSMMEEFFYRFVLISPKAIKTKFYWAGIIFSVLLFSLMHIKSQLTFYNLTNMLMIKQLILTLIPYINASIIYSYLYIHTQDIKVPMIAHTAYDLLAFVFLLIRLY